MEPKIKIWTAHHPRQLPTEFDNSASDYLSVVLNKSPNDPGKDSYHHIVVLLPQRTIWELDSTLFITVHHAELATEGYPTDPNLQAQIHTVGKTEATAINFHNTDHVKLSHLIIDGRRPDLGYLKGGGALVTCGGRLGKDPVVQHCTIRHPRGWSCLHVFDNCEGARIIGNKIGPAGLPAPDGPWADGLSIACRNGLIANNEITDATDGAIVLFCAPGTICVGNTIIAHERNLLGAINMVDAGPYDGDYTNTRVFNNLIKSRGAYIKLGIGIGPLTWSPGWGDTNRGGKVFDNVFGPGRFGYAIGMAGCRGFQVIGNRIAEGTQYTGDMSSLSEPLNAPPMPFLVSNQPGLVEDCELQSDFVGGRACYLIGIEDGPCRILRCEGPQLDLQSTSRPINLDLATLKLEHFGELKLISNSTSQILWSSGSRSTRPNGTCKLAFGHHGHLTITEIETGKVIWNPMESLEGKIHMGHRPSLTISDRSPFLVARTESNSIAWASEYVFDKGNLELKAGQFICIPLNDQPVPPPIPPRIGDLSIHAQMPPRLPTRPSPGRPRPVFIYLDPNTSNLVIHTGEKVDQPFGAVIWASDLFDKYPKQIPSPDDGSNATKCVFQGGDGNLVIYANPYPDKSDERCAVWASCTVCEKLKINMGGPQSLVEICFLDANDEIVKKIPC